MAIQQMGSGAQVAAGPFEQRREDQCEDRKQTLLALLILVLYLGTGISGSRPEISERIKDCTYPQNPMESQAFDYQINGPAEGALRTLRSWLKMSLHVFLEKLEEEVRELERLVRDLEFWLDTLLGEPHPEEACFPHKTCL